MNKNKKNLSGYGFSFKDYIKILENPNKIGLNNGIWSAPILKGYDKNQRGYGIDINTNKKAKALTNNRPGRWLTEKEADTLMDDHINYITEAANKHIKGFSKLPFRRRWALLGMLYRGDSVNKSGININEPDDLKFFKSISDYYRSKGLNTRANSSDEFFNRPISKLLSMFKLKQGGQVRKMQTAAGGPLQLTPEELKYLEWSKMTPELKREYRVNRAKLHLLSGPNITNFWEAFQTYIGNRDPENPHLQVGDVPNPGMRNPKLIIQGVLKAESIALRAAKISDKVFDRQYWRAISSGNSKRVLAVRDLHFKGKSGLNKLVTLYHNTPNIFNLFKIQYPDEVFFHFDPNLLAVKGLNSKGNIKNTYLNVKNSLEIADPVNWNWSRIIESNPEIEAKLGLNKWSVGKYYDELTYKLGSKEAANKYLMDKLGYDGFSYKNIIDFLRTGINSTSTAVPTSSLIKLSDAITYDNNGNIIPISQRDNFLTNDTRYKQGGKMNIIDFLKNGSGIHIKKENRGKFTDYCGGKVTNECIRKAKASGNPTLVKRATFALNSRHWSKHKNGGLIIQLFKMRRLLSNLIK